MPEEFRWVRALHQCSPFEVFKILQKGCEGDIEDRNAARPDEPVGFKIAPQGPNSFLVLRQGNRISASVEFNWDANGIRVRGDNGAAILEATLTLNDQGECRLRVGSELLSFWQFRKRALEDLFFRWDWPK